MAYNKSMKNETTLMTTPIQKEIAGNTLINRHPITPPPDLLDRWNTLPCHISTKEIFVMVARWGADQELEACCEVLRVRGAASQMIKDLRTARRPKPLSLKEQALKALKVLPTPEGQVTLDITDLNTIRRALEALPND